MNKLRKTCLFLCLLLIFPLAGCKTDEAVIPLEEPLALSHFSFYHRGSSTGEIYSCSVEKTDSGSHIYIELNAGYHVVEADVEEDVLANFGAVASQYRLDKWNGFNKVKSRVSDGSGFTLNMITAQGENISANGSNAFPDGYNDAEKEIWAIIDYLAATYGNL